MLHIIGYICVGVLILSAGVFVYAVLTAQKVDEEENPIDE